MALDHVDFSPPPAIEQATQKPARSTEQIIAQVNTGLPSWVRLELPKTKEEKERAVYELATTRLKSRIESGEYKQWITVRYIRDDVYSMKSNETGNVTAYLDEQGKTIFWVKPIKERRYVVNGKVFGDLRLVEKKNGTVYEMYRTTGYMTAQGKREPILEWPINQETEEGYEMWRDVIFHTDIISKLSLLKTPVDVDEKWLQFTIEDGTFRFQDLEPFSARGIIPTEELHKYAVEKLREFLPHQCNPKDPISKRLEKYGDPYAIKNGQETRSMAIRESDLKSYVEKGYIDSELAKQCFQLLPKERRDVSNK